ncbi:hypothetical protein JW992_01730 [candidate division KSB1 bacterium]|nr:hypothetical protein [candidate division KSB1 bacterium]
MPLFHQTLAIGLVLSVLLSERTRFSSAGLIVPGYLAFYFADPIRLTVILAAALLTLAAEKILSWTVILFGRRLLAIDLLFSFLFTALLQALAVALFPMQTDVLDPLAYFVPALLVIFIGANGALITLYSLVLLTLVTRAILLVGLYLGWFIFTV